MQNVTRSLLTAPPGGLGWQRPYWQSDCINAQQLFQCLTGVSAFSPYNMEFIQTTQRIAQGPLTDSNYAPSGRSMDDSLEAFPPPLTSTLTESRLCEEDFQQDTQTQLDVGAATLIGPQISSRAALLSASPPASPPALPECSTRWYRLVMSETVTER